MAARTAAGARMSFLSTFGLLLMLSIQQTRAQKTKTLPPSLLGPRLTRIESTRSEPKNRERAYHSYQRWTRYHHYVRRFSALQQRFSNG